MDFVAIVLLLSTAVFLFLSVVWRADEWFNIVLKIILILMTIANGLAALHHLGWMVQVPG